MTTLRTAAQQALEALEKVGLRADARRGCDEAVGILRAALAQQAEPVAWLQPKTVDGYSRPDLGYEACSSADYGAFPVYRDPPKAEPVQEQAEPVASLMTHVQSGDVEVVWNDDGFDRELWHETPLYTAPPRCPNCASLEAQNDELDRKLAELERAHGIKE